VINTVKLCNADSLLMKPFSFKQQFAEVMGNRGSIVYGALDVVIEERGENRSWSTSKEVETLKLHWILWQATQHTTALI
jgi:hypothetical protein